MADARAVLFDDGALVEVGRRVVRRRADELDAARVRPMIRLRPDEGRQERVVDVDDAARVGRAELVRDDLHVSSEDDEVDLLVFEERELLVLHLCDSILRHRAGMTSRRWRCRNDVASMCSKVSALAATALFVSLVILKTA